MREGDPPAGHSPEAMQAYYACILCMHAAIHAYYACIAVANPCPTSVAIEGGTFADWVRGDFCSDDYEAMETPAAHRVPCAGPASVHAGFCAGPEEAGRSPPSFPAEAAGQAPSGESRESITA